MARIVLVGLLSLIILVQGCSKTDSAWIRNRSNDYKASAVQPPLLMPEEFKTVPRSDRYQID
jgi:uncharacterized lipoprotein